MINGGGGQGRFPGDDIKGHTYFGQTGCFGGPREPALTAAKKLRARQERMRTRKVIRHSPARRLERAKKAHGKLIAAVRNGEGFGKQHRPGAILAEIRGLFNIVSDQGRRYDLRLAAADRLYQLYLKVQDARQKSKSQP